MKKAIVAFVCLLLAVFLASCRHIYQDGSDLTSTNTNTDITTAFSANSTENPKTDFQYEISANGDAVYINKYIGTSKSVVIPSQIDGLPVISIKGVVGDFGFVQEGAFEGCDIQSVAIPKSVTAVGLYAFKNCTELTKITVSKNLETLLDGAFQNCEKLKAIDLSTTKLSYLGGVVFYDCINLTEITLPPSLTEIGEKAFYNCSSLSEIILPEGLTRVGEAAFADCTALKTITIPVELDLFVMRFPVFSNMPNLETIIFQEGRKVITGYAYFDITSDVKIIIPKTVKKFSPHPFFIRGSANILFEGDCPEIVEKNDFYGNPTIFYHPNTNGWDACIWKDQYTLKPME